MFFTQFVDVQKTSDREVNIGEWVIAEAPGKIMSANLDNEQLNLTVQTKTFGAKVVAVTGYNIVGYEKI